MKVADFTNLSTGQLVTEILMVLSVICGSVLDKAHFVEVNSTINFLAVFLFTLLDLSSQNNTCFEVMSQK